MRNRSESGFTLIELMVVLVIIAIFAALAVPQLSDVSRRNKLTDLTNMVQQSAAMVRNFAVQTRHAAVLEVRADDGELWINVLDGPTCWSNLRLADRCMHNLGKAATTDATNKFNMADELYLDAGAYLCGVEYAAMTDTGCGLSTLGPNAGFALCYAATGDLYIRPSEDDTGCDGPAVAVAGTTILGRDDWERSCTWLETDEVPLSGAVLSFNRFDDAPDDCDSAALGVKRAVYVPIGSAPFSKVSP